MKAVTANQKLAEFERLGKQSQKNLWLMLKLAHEMLENHRFVEANGGRAAMIRMLQDRGFSHFGGKPSLESMLRAYEANPEEKTWIEYRHNIRAMIDLAKPESEATGRTRKNKDAIIKELEAEVAALRAANAEIQRSLQAERVKCEAMLRENGELLGRVKTLESILSRRRNRQLATV